MKASLTNYRQAPRKVRLVADSMRGKNVSDAMAQLSFMPKKAAGPLKKLLLSAVANAKQNDDSAREENLIVKTITVDKGTTLFRHMPRAFGRASTIRKESSHVALTLGEKADKKSGKKSSEKSAEKK